MAIVIDNSITGSIDNITYKKTKNGTTAFKKITRTKQTLDTKAMATVFGMASKLRSMIATDMSKVVSLRYDSKMHERLESELIAILGRCFSKTSKTYTFEADSFHRLEKFEFNVNSIIKDYLWKEPVVKLNKNNQLVVTLPALRLPHDLSFPNGANNCEFTVDVMQMALKEGYHRAMLTQKLEIKLEDKEVSEQTLTFEVNDGCLIVVGIGLNYFNLSDIYKTVLNDKNFNPARINTIIMNSGKYEHFVAPVSHEASIQWRAADFYFK
jgi:hypothetical protein